MTQEVADTNAMMEFGAQIGARCLGGEVIELVGDIGAGKTTFTKGLAKGMGIEDDIQSPTFTISRVYDANSGLTLAHYDFYRLEDAGIMNAELHESVNDTRAVTVVEWGGVVAGVLPADTLAITITPAEGDMRVVTLVSGGERSKRLIERLK
jgi:tRNA threonylcarbamoyladenosine biosynthesis protein TsaE